MRYYYFTSSSKLFSFIFRHIGAEAAQAFSVLLKNAYILKPDTLRLAALDRGRRGLCDRGRPAALALNTPTVLQGKGAGKGEAWENTEASKQQPVTQTAAHTLQYCPHTVTMHKGGKVPVIWILLSSTYCKKQKSAVNVEAGAQSLLYKASRRKSILCVIMMKGRRKRNRTDFHNAWDTDVYKPNKPSVGSKWISKMLFVTLFSHKRVYNIQRGKNNTHSAPQCGLMGVRQRKRKIDDPPSLEESFDRGHAVTFELWATQMMSKQNNGIWFLLYFWSTHTHTHHLIAVEI